MLDLLNDLERLIKNERQRADKIHPPVFNSNHEAYAVIYEELDEAQDEEEFFSIGIKKLWDLIKRDEKCEELYRVMYTIALRACAEWLQVAAMCEKAIESEGKND